MDQSNQWLLWQWGMKPKRSVGSSLARPAHGAHQDGRIGDHRIARQTERPGGLEAADRVKLAIGHR